MVNTYMKGYRSERELVHKFTKEGFMSMRAPRSGRIDLPAPDVIAIKNNKVFAIECKHRKSAFSIKEEQLEQLKEWEAKAGAHVFVGWKRSYKGWLFIHVDDVISNNCNIGKKFAREKGIAWKDLIIKGDS